MKIKQYIDVKLKKKKAECFQLLKEVYGDSIMSRSGQWQKKISK
jgi:hypothetical protein